MAEEFVDISDWKWYEHLSPANGEEDFDIAVKRNLQIFVPVDDRVIFTEKAGVFKDLLLEMQTLRLYKQ